MKKNAVLLAEDISKSFSSGKTTQHIIRRCSLALETGELTLLMGPSGSGKSTLLSILSGLLRPDAGRVFALESDLWSLTESAMEKFRLHHCGYIFQGFNLFSALTALENVSLPLRYLGVGHREIRVRSLRALAEVGLSHVQDLRPLELSGGEKQRVAIARALVKDPRFIFADEPTSSLDGENGQAFIRLLKGVVKNHGATALCVTHDPRLLRHADRVIELEDGVVKDRTSPSHVGDTAMEVDHELV